MNEQTAFNLAEDGWFHIAAFGEWPHRPTGLTQIIDDECADEIIKAFTEFRAAPNWPGVLIDFDHQSLDIDKPTVAAGWIVDLAKRDNGIWARVRWSDLGRQSLEGGRYRFISPVWKAGDCAKLGNDRIRPLKLMNCAVTNDPNMRGLYPLSNADAPARDISAPPMEIRPQSPPVSSSAGAPTAPPTRRAISIPAPFSNAILANRTAWTPAETRRRYRFALANRSPMSDDQRKAMFARFGGGSGGGGGGGGSSIPSAPAAQPAPAAVPAAVRPNPYAAEVEGLQAQRDVLAQSLRAPPERHTGYSPIDVAAAVSEAMRKPGATATDVIRARTEAKAENARRKAAWKTVEDYYKKAYKDKAAGKRALDKYTERVEAQYQKDLAEWEKATQKTKEQIAEIDRKLTTAEAKAKAREFDDEQAAQDREAKEQARIVRLQIEQDKAAERAKVAAARAEKQAQDKVIQDAKRETQRPKLFWNLLAQGNKAAAMQLYPDVNYAQAAKEYAFVTSAQRDSSNWRVSQQALEDFEQTPPPMGKTQS